MAQAAKFGPKIRLLRRRHGLRAGGSGGEARHLGLLPEPDRARPAAADGGPAAPAGRALPGGPQELRLGRGGPGRLRPPRGLRRRALRGARRDDDGPARDGLERDGLAGDREAVPRVPRRARVDAGDGVARFGRRRPARDRSRRAFPPKRSPTSSRKTRTTFRGSRRRPSGWSGRRASSGPDPYPGLVAYLERRGISVAITPHPGDKSPMRWYDPARKRLHVSEILPPHARNFQVAHQIGLLALHRGLRARHREIAPDDAGFRRALPRRARELLRLGAC